MPNNTISISDLRRNTATPDEFSVRILNSENGLFLKNIKDEVKDKRFRTKAEILNSVMEGMRKYILSRKTPPSVRQKLWLTCKEWVDRIADELGVDTDYSFEECLSKPIVEEPEIALIKALHTNDPKTKKDLGEELVVSEKSVQTYLRRICPDLQRTGKSAPPCRVCGQGLRANITETTDTFGIKVSEIVKSQGRLLYRPVQLIRVLQVKEKFGILWFYHAYTDADEEISALDAADGLSIRFQPGRSDFHKKIDGIIEKWEKESANVCMSCGKPGKLRNDLSWIQTLCDDCYKKQ